MAETATKTNLFAKAKKVEPKKATEQKLEVVIPEAKHEGFSVKLKRLAELRKQVDEAATEIATLEQDVKEVGKETFIDLYERNKAKPDSFVLVGEKGGKFLIIMQDKYAGVPDDETASLLRETYGSDVVYTNTEYKFNSALLEKHMEALSEAITACAAIPDEDKENLFVVSEKHAIAKGAIERYMQYEPGKRREFLFTINPIIQLKNR